jgi:hypothetical protein
VALVPSAAALGNTGLWIYPHDHQADVLNGLFLDSFYAADNASAWVADSFFADSSSDSASVRVDLYNPTETDLVGVQLFAAISDIDLFTSVSFAGGDGGEFTSLASDLGGGTPILADGSSLDGHRIYPAYFTSYSVGDIAASESSIVTLWVNVTGDFAGGLIVHLDYAAADGNGVVYTGPFEADMNILEAERPGPSCQDAQLAASVTPLPSSDPTLADLALSWQFPDLPASTVTQLVVSLPLPDGLALQSLEGGTVAGDVLTFELGSAASGDAWSVTLHFVQLDTLIATSFTFTETVTWLSCAGNAGSASASATVHTSLPAAGPPLDLHTWHHAFVHAAKADPRCKGPSEARRAHAHPAVTQGLTVLLERVALASSVFTYGPWNGTTPAGGPDGGWIDIARFCDAADALSGHTKDPKASHQLERELLALWLNVAAGRVGADQTLTVGAGHTEHGKSPFEAHTGLAAPGEPFDTPAEILAFAEGVLEAARDDGRPPKADARLATDLCKSVNEGWLLQA